jgi:hypothetical protein
VNTVAITHAIEKGYTVRNVVMIYTTVEELMDMEINISNMKTLSMTLSIISISI